MAPVNPNAKRKPAYNNKNTINKNVKGVPIAGVKKKKWIPENKFFHGSVQEGQGFAFKRKQKIQQQYNKLLRKEKWRTQDSSKQLKEEYPEHLKHLYMAEQERLNKEELLNEDRRRKGRRGDAEVDEEAAADSVDSSFITRTAEMDTSEKSDALASVIEVAQSSQIESSQRDQQKHRKWNKMSSYQKMKEDYERKKEERERKREEYLKDKTEREEALKKYKDRKLATYQMLKKKTKKGQPNLNLQMELLLQKIQAQRK